MRWVEPQNLLGAQCPSRQRISRPKNSPTPIVKVIVGPDGKEQEEIVLLACGMKKKEGDKLSQRVVDFLNAAEYVDNNIKL